MYGEPIQAVDTGFKVLISALKREPQAMEIVYLSLITFDNQVKQVFPLTEVSSIQNVTFTANGGTSLGGALEQVTNSAQKEVVKNTPNAKGDYKPLVFIFSDGAATDNVEEKMPTFTSYNWGMVVACAAGSNADTRTLEKIAGPNVLVLDTIDSATITSYFKYLSASIVTTSKKVDLEKAKMELDGLPPLPPEITLLKH
jgi:uncharacterized protein YegL